MPSADEETASAGASDNSCAGGAPGPWHVVTALSDDAADNACSSAGADDGAVAEGTPAASQSGSVAHASPAGQVMSLRSFLDVQARSQSPEPSDSSDLAQEGFETPERLAALGSEAAGALRQSTKLWGEQLTKGWNMWATRKEGEETYSFGNVARGLVKDAMPVVRENLHKLKTGYGDAREQAKERRHELVKKAFTAFDLVEDESSVPAAAEPTADDRLRRRWVNVCAAAHSPHTHGDSDPAKTPGNVRSDLQEAQVFQEPRAVLEVRLLALSIEGAGDFVCQLAMGDQCTGALTPSGWEDSRPALRAGVGIGEDVAVASDARGGEALADPAGLSRVGSGTTKSNAISVGSDGACDLARFEVNEVMGSDLRVHIFDRSSRNFELGFEGRAFCGGALVPLSVLHHRSSGGETRSFDCILERTLEAQVAVKLLPVEAVRDRAKLEPATNSKDGMKQPTGELGSALLHLRLTLQSASPALALLSPPYLGEGSEAHQSSGRIDDPMSVVFAVAGAIQRMKAALDFGCWLQALDEIREHILSCVVLHALWFYAVLLAPTWKMPGCFAAAIALGAWHFSRISKLEREKAPPKLYSDEGLSEEKLSLKERSKTGFKNALKTQLAMIQFAKTVTLLASRIERVWYVLQLRDPCVSVAVAMIAFGAMAMASAWLWFFLLVFGRSTVPLLVWAAGGVRLLPAAGREQVRRAFVSLVQEKERLIGKGKLVEVLRSLWQRIPDGVEAQHYELFERYVLV